MLYDDTIIASTLPLWETVGRVERQRNPTSSGILRGILRPTLKLNLERLLSGWQTVSALPPPSE